MFSLQKRQKVLRKVGIDVLSRLDSLTIDLVKARKDRAELLLK